MRSTTDLRSGDCIRYGLAFTPSKSMIVATNNSLFKVDTRIEGWPVP